MVIICSKLLADVFLLLLEVEADAEEDPSAQCDVGFLVQSGSGTGDSHQEEEDEGADNASNAPAHNRLVALDLSKLPSCSTDIEEADGGAEGGHVNDPGQSSTAQHGGEHAGDTDEEDSVDRSSGALGTVAEHCGQSLLLCHCGHQTGGGEDEAVDSGENCAGHSEAQQVQGGLAQSSFDSFTVCPEGSGVEVLSPVGVAFLCDHSGCKSGAGVHQNSADDSDDHESLCLGLVEVVLFADLGDNFKTDHCPGSHGQDDSDAGEDRLTAGTLEEGTHVVEVSLAAGNDDQGECNDDSGLGQSQEGLRHECSVNILNVQDGECADDQNGDDDLTQVNIEAGDVPQVVSLQNGVGEDVTGDQTDSGAVEGNEGGEGQDQEPAADECVGLAEGLGDILKLAAFNGVLDQQVGVALCDDPCHYTGKGHTDQGAEGTSCGQEGVAGHDETAPADDSTDCNRQNVYFTYFLH